MLEDQRVAVFLGLGGNIGRSKGGQPFSDWEVILADQGVGNATE